MAKLKKPDLQRQTSERLQARAATIIPVHRESIVGQTHTSTFPGHSGTITIDTDSHPNGSPEGRRSSCHQLPPQTDQWMTKFCAEPPGGDANTCCLGCWVPCVLYGKVNWMLNQKSRGEVINDWGCTKCCNSPCWAYWACGLIPVVGCHGIFDGAAAGWQRSQIRGTYGIEGSCIVDIVAGICCSSCVLMQNDREIRAREGDTHLQNNKKYRGPSRRSSRRSLVVTEQPKRKAQMVAPGLFKLPQSTSAAQPRRRSFELAPIADANVAAKGQGRHEKTRNKSLKVQPLKGNTAAAIKESAQEHQQPEKEQSKGKTPQRIQKPQQSEKTQSKRITNSLVGKSELAIVKRRNSVREVLPMVVVTEPEDTSLGRVDSQVLSQGESSKTPGDQSSDRLSREHDLEKYSASDVSDEVDTPIHQETHLLADSTPVEEIQKRRVESTESHALSVCSPTIEPTSGTSIAVQQHTLADCSSSTSSMPKVQEISHAHDFANCRSTVLEYYEEGEKKVQPQNISNRGRVRTASNAQVVKGVQEHFLEGCPTDGSASNPRTTNENQEHFLEFCPTSSSGSCDDAEREDAREGTAARFAPISLNGMDGIREHLGENLVDISPKNSTPSFVLNTSQQLVPAGSPIINFSPAMIRSDVQQKSRAIKYANRNENLSVTDSQRLEIGEIQRVETAVHDLPSFTCSIVNRPVPTGCLHDLPRSKTLSRISRYNTLGEMTKVGGGVSSTLKRSLSYGGFTARESWTWIIGSGSDIGGVRPRLIQTIPDQKQTDRGQVKRKASENATEADHEESSRAAGYNAQNSLQVILRTIDEKKEGGVAGM